VVIRYATRRANQRGLANIRFAVGNARDFMQRLVPAKSVSEIHLYHPQPYYDIALVHRRLITPEFALLLYRSLVPEALLVVQTDNPGYWRYMQALLPVFFHWTERDEPWPDAPHGRTRREIISIQRGLRVYRGEGKARANLDTASARQIADRLPPPLFDADRRFQELDRLD
jgi:tRNA (guanine-N7-)-methyltransferase